MNMEEKNKRRWGAHIKNIALLAWGVLTVIAFADVFNKCQEPSIRWCVGLLSAVNIFCIIVNGNWISKQDKP